jgi:hypothetical protein
MMNVHPHPDPLPQERENRLQRAGGANVLGDLRHPQVDNQKTVAANQIYKFSSKVALLSLSPGERVGVRASVNSNLDWPHPPRTPAAFPVFPA